MNFKELYIRDFGIFRHQRIKNLNNNINVIGGLNRAGKTTFLEMIRYLPYGFPKRDNFIPANNKYDVEALIEHKKEKYNLLTKGYSSPILKKINIIQNEEINIKDIYNIDNFSYEQLYTISLNQLKRIPENVTKNEEKLQSILLGAGFGKLLELQELKDEFNKKAEKIGGKNGTVNVKEFKEYYQGIKKGIKLRSKANNELTEFKTLKENLDSKKQKINKLVKIIDKLKLKKDRLDLLKNNYSKLKKIEQLLQENNYIDVNTFQVIDLDSIYKKLTSINERLKNHKRERKNISLKKQDFLRELKSLNSNWNDESYLNYVLNLRLDFIEKEKIDNYIYEYKDLKNKIEKLEQEKETIKNRVDKLKNKNKNINEKINRDYNKKYIIISIIVIIIGVSTFLLNWPIALLITFFGISSNYFYNKEKRDKVNFYEKEKAEFEKDLTEAELKLKEINNNIKSAKNQKEKINILLDKVKERLDLKNNIKVDILRDYLKEINIVRNKINQWKIRKNELKENKNKLKNQFEEINKNLLEFNFSINKDFDIYENTSILIEKIEKLIEFKKLRTNVLSTLKTDRAKNAFINHNSSVKESEEKLWSIFYNFYKNYISKNDVENNYENVKNKLKKEKANLEKAKNSKQSIKDNINRLESSNKLKRARKIIFKNRKKLKKKAENYGKNLTASFILEKVYNNTLDNMKDEIFKLASKYLEKITREEYVKILPAYDLSKIDFRTILNNGSKYETTEVLSRGTKEQLFLAVRLSRIKAMDNKLPVIFDDSLVNFDSYHLKNTLDLITDISEHNQVFILTCHSNLIEKIEKNNKNMNYWKLQEGEFEKTSKEELINYLSGNFN